MIQKFKNYLEICGGIATGKTTLCQRLSERGIHAVFENFQTNPFWKDFYNDPRMYAFETELSFHLQHYSSIKSNLKYKNFACDFSLVQDMAYADINLTHRRHELFCDVAKELRDEIGFPSVLIHVFCHERLQLERIQTRNREPENKISVEYLRLLNLALEKRVFEANKCCRVVCIDSSKNDFRVTIPSELKNII